LKASILAMLDFSSATPCVDCQREHPPFTECGRCGRQLGDGECFICTKCDSDALEFQERKHSIRRRERTVRAYADAGIPYEIAAEVQDCHLPHKINAWAQASGTGWAGYAHDNLGERRSHAARGLLRRMRTRLPNGAAIVNVNELAMLGPIEIADRCRTYARLELLVVDIPSPIPTHAEDKIFAMLSERHWSGKKPKATLVTRALSIGESEIVNEILRMVRSLNPRGDAPLVIAGREKSPGQFVQRCYVCHAELMAASQHSFNWVCAECKPVFIETDTRFDRQAE